MYDWVGSDFNYLVDFFNYFILFVIVCKFFVNFLFDYIKGVVVLVRSVLL